MFHCIYVYKVYINFETGQHTDPFTQHTLIVSNICIRLKDKVCHSFYCTSNIYSVYLCIQANLYIYNSIDLYIPRLRFKGDAMWLNKFNIWYTLLRLIRLLQIPCLNSKFSTSSKIFQQKFDLWLKCPFFNYTLFSYFWITQNSRSFVTSLANDVCIV